jgi:hypothetical protein
MSKNWQRVTKRERERAVELKRTQKRERKQAERAARKDGAADPEPTADEEQDAVPAVPSLETSESHVPPA